MFFCKQMRWVTAPNRTILCALLLLLLAVTYVVASHESHSTNRRNGSKGRKRNGGRSTTTTTTASPQFEFLNETSSSFFDGDDEDDVEAAAQHQQDQPPGGVETCEVARLKCAYRVGCGMALQVRLGYMSTTHFFIFVAVSTFVFLLMQRCESWNVSEREKMFPDYSHDVSDGLKTINESRCVAVEQC